MLFGNLKIKKYIFADTFYPFWFIISFLIVLWFYDYFEIEHLRKDIYCLLYTNKYVYNDNTTLTVYMRICVWRHSFITTKIIYRIIQFKLYKALFILLFLAKLTQNHIVYVWFAITCKITCLPPRKIQILKSACKYHRQKLKYIKRICYIPDVVLAFH